MTTDNFGMLAALPVGFAYCFECEVITGWENHLSHWKITKERTDREPRKDALSSIVAVKME